MPVLLHIDSSAGGDASRTRVLTREFADAWRARGEEWTVVSRDLHEHPPPHLRTPAQHWPEHLRGGGVLDARTVALQNELIEELCAADAVVVGAPMYNYAMPSTLKAWVDLVHVPEVTSVFGGAPDPLPLQDKPVVLVTARGAGAGAPTEELVQNSLRTLFDRSFGMQVHAVATSRTLAEMIPALGAEEAEAELEAAKTALRELAGSL